MLRNIALAAGMAVATAQIPPYNLVERLQLIPEMSTLVTAVVAGNLAGALSGTGPFTIFAPDDYAFDRLPPGVLDRLLANVTLLDEVLTYHVASGNVSSSQLTDGMKIPTLDTPEELTVNIFVDRRDNTTHVTVNRDSQVTSANNYATNGVFHIIDRVLIPRAAMSAGLRAVFEAAEEEALIAKPVFLPALNLVQRLQLIPEYSTLVTAVVAANLAGALSGAGPFTLFAPDNFAFDRLPPGVLDRLLHNITELTDILTYHVVSGNVSSSQLTDNEDVPTLEGKNIHVNIFNETRPQPRSVYVLDHHAQVTYANNYATNGVFHGVDEVLLPPRA